MAVMPEERQPVPPVGTGLALRDPLAWDAFAGLASEAEGSGYRAVFCPEIAGRDAFAALTGLAGSTRTILLGTGVAPMTSRIPRLTAMGAATVHERSGGRAILGLGTGPGRKGALDALERQVAELRSLLGSASASFGDEDPEPLSLAVGSPLPIWISALGPRSVRLAGRIADGVLLNWCSPERVAQARTAIREAAADAGRDPAAVAIAVYVRSCVDQGDPDAALAAVKAAAGEYASYPAYARQFAAMGLGSEAEAAATAYRSGQVGAVPEGFVNAICLVGDARTARARIEAYRDAGAHLPVVYPVLVPGGGAEGSVAASMRGLAPGAKAPGVS